VPQEKAVEGAKKDVGHLGLVDGAGEGGLHVDGEAYVEVVRDARRSKDKQAFDGEMLARAAAKFAAGIELTEEEKQARKKHSTNSRAGGKPLFSLTLYIYIHI